VEQENVQVTTQSALVVPKYVVITPVRDEGEFISLLIAPMLKQTILPVEWIIVDDGSTDGTAAIVKQHTEGTEWIRVIQRKNRGFRQAGAGVVEAFYDGYETISRVDWDFVVKLDGDLTFAEDYFENCFDHFRQNPRLGIGGGTLYNLDNDEARIEENPLFHVRGATKIYRRACWEAIGGLLKIPGWDTIDEVKAHMLGWTTQSFPDVRSQHHRLVGEAYGAWQDSVKCGRGSYIVGYHPLYMLAKCVKRLLTRPVLVGSAGMLWGFVSGYFRRIPQVNDPGLIGYIRSQQLARLLGRETIWR
jgi:glycosyltransferase involved in cell wall biosynthesis